jgi:hypothetical protein
MVAYWIKTHGDPTFEEIGELGLDFVKALLYHRTLFIVAAGKTLLENTESFGDGR